MVAPSTVAFIGYKFTKFLPRASNRFRIAPRAHPLDRPTCSDPAILTVPRIRLDTALVTADSSFVRIAGREYLVVRPRIGDPRFHIAAVIVGLHVLGQTSLGFDVSILQIIVAVGTAGIIGFAVTVLRDRTIAWPASAVLAGNGVAFVLRVPGTHHGDWWAGTGWWVFSATAALAVCSKYVIRYRGSHVFNPSNLALVVTFLVLGSRRADPLAFWWGPWSNSTGAALVIILAGGFALLARLRAVAIAASFWLTFTVSIGLLASTNHCMVVPWHLVPVCGRSLWWTLITSPEVLVFLFFMITDPRTSPSGRVSRIVYGAAIGILAALLAAPQSTEFATKVAVLSALTIACGARPFVERWLPSAGAERDRLRRFVMPEQWQSGGALARPAGLALCLLLTGLLLVSTAPNKVDAAPAGSAPPGAPRRPTFAAGELEAPSVGVNPSDRMAASIDAATLASMGRDVVEDVTIIATAQRTDSIGLLATAAADDALQKFERQMTAPDASGRNPYADVRISRITISVAQRLGQGIPAIMATIRGTSGRESGTATRSPVFETYEIKPRDGVYIIVTDDLPPGFTPP